MPEFILHHYPPSPVAEKIRAGFGLKSLEWRSVEQNRLPDRPELFAMTGGYRRIPVMQIGADIYCDTQCILRELEVRAPEPTFFPNQGTGLPFALSRWTDGELFNSAFRVAFAPVADGLPEELVSDRARLYLGPDGDLEKEVRDLPHTLAQFRAQLGWVEDRLGSGRLFILGDAAGMPDLLVWFIYWFVSQRYAGAEEFFSEFPLLNAWAGRMSEMGHGLSTPMTPAEALAVAKETGSTTPEHYDPRDPQGLKPGMTATVQPVTDSGEKAVKGVIRATNRDTIVLTLDNPLCGEVAVHFPRVGYRVSIV